MENRKSIVKVLSLLFIVFAIVLAGLSGCKSKDKKLSPGTRTDSIYTCAMHPQIIRNAPGNCPICGMPLVKKENASREIPQADLSTLLQGGNNTVVSSIPVTTMQDSRQEITLEALGSIGYDTRFIKNISARVSGRIEKLYIKYRYQPVHAGDKVMEIYSPELLTAQEDLLFLVKNDPSNRPLIDAARQKLLLLGMTETGLQGVISTGKAIFSVPVYSNYTGHVHEAGAPESTPMSATDALSVKEGMYVEKGQPVFQVNNMNHVWVTLDFFPGENSLIKVGTPVTILAETAPGKKILARIGFIEPFFKNGSTTLSARVYLDNSKYMLPIGSQVKATLDISTGFHHWLPLESVLSLGFNKVVFLKKGTVFKARRVTTGMVANHLIEVIDGLSAQDSVAMNAQFLTDSEEFIKAKK